MVVEKLYRKYTVSESRRRLQKLSGDVILKIFNYVFLLFDNMFDNVSDGYKANQMIAVNHRQMSNEFTGHEVHAIFDGSIRSNRNWIFGHEVANGRIF